MEGKRRRTGRKRVIRCIVLCMDLLLTLYLFHRIQSENMLLEQMQDRVEVLEDSIGIVPASGGQQVLPGRL